MRICPKCNKTFNDSFTECRYCYIKLEEVSTSSDKKVEPEIYLATGEKCTDDIKNKFKQEEKDRLDKLQKQYGTIEEIVLNYNLTDKKKAQLLNDIYRFTIEEANLLLNAVCQSLKDTFIPINIRVAIVRRDSWKCCNCRTEKNLIFSYKEPILNGGAISESNIYLLCKRCENHKNARGLQKWFNGLSGPQLILVRIVGYVFTAGMFLYGIINENGFIFVLSVLLFSILLYLEFGRKQ